MGFNKGLHPLPLIEIRPDGRISSEDLTLKAGYQYMNTTTQWIKFEPGFAGASGLITLNPIKILTVLPYLVFL